MRASGTSERVIPMTDHLSVDDLTGRVVVVRTKDERDDDRLFLILGGLARYAEGRTRNYRRLHGRFLGSDPESDLELVFIHEVVRLAQPHELRRYGFATEGG